MRGYNRFRGFLDSPGWFSGLTWFVYGPGLSLSPLTPGHTFLVYVVFSHALLTDSGSHVYLARTYAASDLFILSRSLRTLFADRAVLRTRTWIVRIFGWITHLDALDLSASFVCLSARSRICAWISVGSFSGSLDLWILCLDLLPHYVLSHSFTSLLSGSASPRTDRLHFAFGSLTSFCLISFSAFAVRHWIVVVA